MAYWCRFFNIARNLWFNIIIRGGFYREIFALPSEHAGIHDRGPALTAGRFFWVYEN